MARSLERSYGPAKRPKLEEAKRNGKIAYFVLDKLIVKDRRG